MTTTLQFLLAGGWLTCAAASLLVARRLATLGNWLRLLAIFALLRATARIAQGLGAPIGVTLTVDALTMALVITLIVGIVRSSASIRRQEATEALFERVFASGGDAIWVLDAKGHTILINPAAQRLTGFTEDDILGKSSHPIIHHTRADGAPYPIVECPIYKSVAQGEPCRVDDEVFWRKDGTSFPVSYTSTPIFDRAGAQLGAVQIFRDVTAERQAVADREASQIVSELYEVSQSINRRRDLHEIVQVVTDSVARVTGAEIGAFFYNVLDGEGGQYLLFTLSGADREQFEAFGMPRNTDVFNPTFMGERVVRSDDITAAPEYGNNSPHHGMPAGHWPVRSYLAVPVILADGSVAGGLFLGHSEPARFGQQQEDLAVGIASQAAVAIDTVRLLDSERVAREQAETRAQSAISLEYVGDGVILLDTDGLIQLWNPAAERLTGVPAAEARGQRLPDVVPGWDVVTQQVTLADAGPGAAGQARLLPLQVDGNERWISMHGASFEGGTVYAFRDMTDEQRLERIRTEMVATVSHELRTPVTSVFGAAQTLGREDIEIDDATRAKLMDVITNESERLTALVEEILLASNITSGLVLNVEPVDVAEVVRTVAATAEVATAPELEISCNTPDELRADADPTKLRQILVNLLDNARKYGSSGGRIQLTVEEQGDRVACSVRDWGPGIPADEQERVFERFYRLDPHLNGGVGGTGLGLYICRELVERMGGVLTLRSAPGEGSTFTVLLPRAGG